MYSSSWQNALSRQMSRRRIIAIDGPAAMVTSAVAFEVSRRLNCICVDAGSFYRGAAWKMLQVGAGTKNPQALVPALLTSVWRFQVRGRAVVFSIDGVEPGGAADGEDVCRAVADIAAIPAVRRFVVARLRELTRLGSLAMGGCDIGSVVFPESPYKFYLDAGPQEREEDDCRAAPLGIADGAYVIDTSDCDVAGVSRVLLGRVSAMERPGSDKRINAFWYRFTVQLIWVALRVSNSIRVHGVQNVPKNGGVIIASNHASYLDPPAIGSASRRVRMTYFMARDTLFENPFMRTFLNSHSVIPLGREPGGDLKAMKTAIRRLKAGASVALFPEGTRTPDGNLQPAKPGVGFLTVRGQSPVVPVYVHGTYETLSRHGGGLRRTPIHVVFGRLITREEIQRLGSGPKAYPLIGGLIMDRIAGLRDRFKAGRTAD